MIGEMMNLSLLRLYPPGAFLRAHRNRCRSHYEFPAPENRGNECLKVILLLASIATLLIHLGIGPVESKPMTTVLKTYCGV